MMTVILLLLFFFVSFHLGQIQGVFRVARLMALLPPHKREELLSDLRKSFGINRTNEG